MPNLEEYAEFRSVLIEKLPVTLRVNSSQMQHERFIDILKDPQFVLK